MHSSGDSHRDSKLTDSRGSTWHRWDPHIHTPGTVLEDRYPPNSWDEYLQSLETADSPVEAIGVTDYCITRSYELFLEHVQRTGRLSGRLIFPNIELRLDIATVKGQFVNIHLLVDPKDPNHLEELNRFLGKITFHVHGDDFSCTPKDLIRLGRRADSSIRDDEAALRHGVTQFKVSIEKLMETYARIEWAQENILIAVSGSGDGTSGLKEAADASLRVRIEKSAHVMFTSNAKQRDFWLGEAAASPEELRRVYDGRKPCLWGCDAHELPRVANPAERRLCWIKGLPAFDALRQACIDPERAYVGERPPSSAIGSQIIDHVTVEGAPWARTPVVRLNPGLVAIIGARGSGKTALVDMIAAGCDAYTESAERPSFLARAREHLSGAQVAVKWQDAGALIKVNLGKPVNTSADAFPRARYLSQQFVEDLCSVEGMPELLREIERVIFESHALVDRDGSVDFDELLELRARTHRETRAREEEALANLSDQIGIEMEKSALVPSLKVQITEKEKLLARYEEDRKALLPKKENKTAERLTELMAAAEKVQGYLRYYANTEASLASVKSEISDLRQSRAPNELRSMKERYQNIGLVNEEWDRFLLRYSGDVDAVVTVKTKLAQEALKGWKGITPAPVDESGAFLLPTADVTRTPLATLEAEIDRLSRQVAADRETAKRLATLTKRITEETAALARLKQRLTDCEGARERAKSLTAEREQGYTRVFDAILSEQQVLVDLYAPLMKRLQAAGGTFAKLSFEVARVVDVSRWAKYGEDSLFDLRSGPFRGIGSLAKEANQLLGPSWTTGASADVSGAMAAFRTKHQDALLEKAPHPRTDQSNYRAWSRRFAQWLYSTGHISIEYRIEYDGIDIRKLSPGTRGIVLLLLYLALDNDDDRPLIIDQPEENLDPKSIYHELVPLFQAAKQKRQVIIVTHNANLVVNTDADQIIVADHGPRMGTGLPSITYDSGGLDEERIRTAVCDILEGGERAFRDRARRLRIALAR